MTEASVENYSDKQPVFSDETLALAPYHSNYGMSNRERQQ
jgi:hypothetical protein